MLLVLIALVCLGLLTLSSISLRGAQQAEAQMRAQANARLALMMAIGELQKELGPDQRVSATSGILDAPDAGASTLRHSCLTGVWTSREDTLGASTPDYDRNRFFRRWLVSTSNPQDLTSTQFASNGSFQNPVELVGKRTPSIASAAPMPAVQAGLVPVKGITASGNGKFAWWVGDENCKGLLNPVASERQKASASVPDVLANTCTPGAYGMQAVDKDFPANTNTAAKILTHGQVSLASTQDRSTTAAWFHDLSPFPRSILCNVTKGGLRQDLSLFLEQSSFDSPPAWPVSGGPTGPLGPNNKIALSDVGEYDVLAWKHLAAWSRLRRYVSFNNGRPYLQSHLGLTSSPPNDITNPRWNAGVLRPSPIPVRCLQFVSYGTKQPDQSDPTKLVVRLYVYPVVVLWNPYNVDLVTPQLNLLFTSMPLTLKIKVNGVEKQSYRWVYNGAGNGVQPYFDQPLTLKAGEAKVLTPPPPTPPATTLPWKWDSLHIAYRVAPVPFTYSQTFAGGEWGNAGGKPETEITVTGLPTDQLEIETIVNDFDNGGAAHDINGKSYQTTFDIRGHNCGLAPANWSTFLWSSKIGWRYRQSNGTPSPNKLDNNVTPKTSFQSVKDAPRPFLVVDAKLKALDEGELPNKIWSHCIPGHAFQGVTDAGGGVTPVCASAYKLTMETISSYQAAASYMQVNPTDQTQTYFGGSYFPQNGQSLISDVEIPMAPLTSLAQLQNLPQGSIDNLYSSGFFFQNHAIGNSFASPGVPSNKVKDSGWPFWLDKYYSENGGTISGQKYSGTQFVPRETIDRSYAANHLLWDDYFFSSIAPKDGKLVPSSDGVSIDQVTRNFYLNNKSLPNERYRPYFYKLAPQIVDDLISQGKPTPTGYKKVAASLLVDGGFNINSTSVNAWKTLLASAHHRPMAVLNSSGGAAQVQPEGKFIVSRFTMPNAPSAETATGPDAKNARWVGYRELSEDQIDALAQAIVRQVKSRGPFRSLSEFINRRLGEESDPLTRYGALQAALEDSAVDINQDYRDKTIDAGFLDQSKVIYANQTAATGSRYQGAPAYVTQADLLGPIAPILNARSDTFVIRAYGEATDGKGRPAARAWCEAVVQRVPDFINAADVPETAANQLQAPVNRMFGRRLQIVNFRWLAGNEI